MKTGDKVKNLVELKLNPVGKEVIPVGTIGTIYDVYPQPAGTSVWFGIEVMFEGFEDDTYPCAASELELTE